MDGRPGVRYRCRGRPAVEGEAVWTPHPPDGLHLPGTSRAPPAHVVLVVRRCPVRPVIRAPHRATTGTGPEEAPWLPGGDAAVAAVRGLLARHLPERADGAVTPLGAGLDTDVGGDERHLGL